VASIAEVAGLIAEGTAIAAAATVLTFAALLGDIFGSMIAFWNVLEENERLAGMRAIAYTTVAWAFDEPVPSLSRELEARWRSQPLTPDLIQRGRRAWDNAAKSTVQELVKGALGRLGTHRSSNTKKLLVQAAKERIKMIASGNKRQVSRFLMELFEPKLNGTILEIWQRNYDFLYNE
jgi:hypothetical protein